MFKNWLENIQDWCISRQIWWGHRIPVYYDENNIPYAAEAAKHPSHKQDEDVLDTWFSSALWPFETLKDNEEIYKHYYPTDVLATAREIINLWVSRMIYSSEYFAGKEPFKDVLIHPVVQTPDGKRMSKSKGNAIDPLEMVTKYGADASRMWYASVGIHGQQDVKFPGRKDAKEGWVSDTFEQYRKFANKLFNASKFVMMQLPEGFKPAPLDETKFKAVDRWIVYKFSECLRSIEYNFQNYSFEKIQETLYSFLWFDFCDWYIEFSKVDVGNKETQQQILFTILEQSLRALHPIMPFITEEIWQTLKAKYDLSLVKDQIFNNAIEAKYQEFITFAKYPSHKNLPDLVSENSINIIQLLLSQLRNVRQTLDIPWSQELDIYLIETGIKTNLIAEIIPNQEYIRTLAKAGQIYYQEYQGNEKYYRVQHGDLQIQIPISNESASKLAEKYKKNIDKVLKDIQILESKLKSEGFVKNASPDKLEEARKALEDCFSQKTLFQKELANLS
jgi:valyl-tRNA synthetase